MEPVKLVHFVKALLLVNIRGDVMKFYVEQPLDLPKDFLPLRVMKWERWVETKMTPVRNGDEWPNLDDWLADGWRFAVAHCAPSVSNDITSVMLEKSVEEVG